MLLDPDLTLYIINEEANATRRARLLSRWNDPILSAERDRLMADQWAWIDQQLSTSTAQWLFVAGHYPVYSAGPHGNSKVLGEKLKPMLDKYQVDAYLSGHVCSRLDILVHHAMALMMTIRERTHNNNRIIHYNIYNKTTCIIM